MDNRTIDVVSEGNEDLALALRLIWSNAPSREATHYKVVRFAIKTEYFNRNGIVTHHFTRLVEDPKGVPTLILFWSEEGSVTQLPFPHNLKRSTEFVEGWLEKVPFGSEPDHDGDNEKGWRVFTEDWGHVAGHNYAIAGIQPAWAMYGK